VPQLQLGVLGPLQVRVDGRPVAVPPGRRRAVLTCLLVHAGEHVSMDALTEAAWGDAQPRDPHAALHTVLSRLRGLLGEQLVEHGPAGYRLVLPAGALDAELFEDLLAQAHTAPPARARELLGRADALWRGPAYGEYADAPFALTAAARLEGLRKDATEAHAAACLECDDPGAAVLLLDPLLAEDPFREHAVELAVLARYRAGRQAEALEVLREHRARLREDLGLDPAPVLTDLEQRILGHRVLRATGRSAAPPDWLDTSTSFIGREDELADLTEAVAANRVTVVTGTGGVGKSRLAAEALGALHDDVGLPVAVAELAPVTPGRVARAVASALRLRVGTDALAQLVEYLAAVPHLLVLDNCEHLREEVADLVTILVRGCPATRVLATSRRRLGVASEQVLPLEPLRVPGPDAPPTSQRSSAAARLFADRVRRLRPGFGLTEENTAAVGRLCARLDGLPLAVELAASRSAVVGIEEVAARLPQELAAPGSGGLGAVVDWSYQLLGPQERTLLALLSVFRGTFTLEAVRGLTGEMGTWRGDVVASLGELVESSLVAVEGPTTRYRLLAVVRAFAAERLAESGLRDAADGAHARWVRALTAELAREWESRDGAGAGRRMGEYSGEVEQAVSWALGAGRTRLAADIAESVMGCLHWVPRRELRDLLIETGQRAEAEPGPDVAGGVAAGAFFAVESGDLDLARRLATAAQAMSDDAGGPGTALLTLGVAAMYAGDQDECVRWFRQLAGRPGFAWEAHASLALVACYRDEPATAREHADIALATTPEGAAASRAWARYTAGEVAARTDPDRGATLLAQAAADADAVGAEQVSRVARVALLAVLVRSGRPGGAVELADRLLGDLLRWGAWVQAWTTVRLLAELFADVGRPAEAAYLLGAAAAAPEAPPPMGLDVPRYAALRTRLEQRLGARVVRGVEELAATAPLAQVLARARRTVHELHTTSPVD